jgi:hypothetical protein
MKSFVYIIMVFIFIGSVSIYFMREKKKKEKNNKNEDFSFSKLLEDEFLLKDDLKEEVLKIKNMNISEQRKYELFLIKTTALQISEKLSDIEHINTVKDIKNIFDFEMRILSNFLKI